MSKRGPKFRFHFVAVPEGPPVTEVLPSGVPLAEQRAGFDLFAAGLRKNFPAGGDPGFAHKVEAWRKAAHAIIDLTADGAIRDQKDAQKLLPKPAPEKVSA